VRLVAVLALAGAFAGLPAGHAVAGDCAAPATGRAAGVPPAQRLLAPDRAWPLTRGAGVRVAVLATGVSAAAPALSGAVLPGIDVRTGGRADTDCAGLGTATAGLVAARPQPGTGFAGIAPAARILPVRVTDDPTRVAAADLAAGIHAAVDAGASVLAIPLGVPDDTAALRRAVDYAVAHHVLPVAAADAGRYPAALPGVLSVAPLPTGTADAVPAALHVPPGDVTTLAPTGAGQVGLPPAGLAAGYAAGAAALVRAYRPALGATAIRQRLLATADHPGGRVPDPVLGFGLLDPVGAVTTVLPAESADRSPRPPVPAADHVVLPAPADPGPSRRAIRFTLAVLALTAAGGGAAAVVRRGNRRRWRPPGHPASLSPQSTAS
jgi:membrane-anchored mycosin MYCP